MSKPSVVFFGNERLATGVTTKCPTVLKLIDEGFEVKAIISHHQTSQSRSKRQLEIAEIAKESSIPHLLPTRPDEILEIVKSHNADIGVLVAFGKIIPQQIIDAFPMGIINVHPSLLPKHRGPTPIESIILNGEDETGVSIIKLSSKMDAGPIYTQKVVKVPKSITKQDLADNLGEVGAELIIETLQKLSSAEPTLIPQNDDEATYDKLISKSDGELDFSYPVVQLERQIRAFAGWPKSSTSLAGMKVVITRASVGSSSSSNSGEVYITDDKKIGITTKDGSLIIEELLPAGKKLMTSSAFLAGYASKL